MSIPPIRLRGGCSRASVDFVGTRQICYSSARQSGPKDPDVKNPNSHKQAAQMSLSKDTAPLLFVPNLKFLQNAHSPTDVNPNLVRNKSV